MINTIEQIQLLYYIYMIKLTIINTRENRVNTISFIKKT